MSRGLRSRQPAREELGRSFLIVSEGENTEPEYFEYARAKLKLGAVQVEVTRSELGTAADQVVEYALQLKRQREEDASKDRLGFGEVVYDEVWAVFDMDTAVRADKWGRARDLAHSNGVQIAHSHPCFEYWILLHWGFTTTPFESYDQTRAELRGIAELRNYGKNQGYMRKTAAPHLWAKANEGVRHAERSRRAHASAGSTFRDPPYTHVDKLLLKLNAAARRENRHSALPVPPPPPLQALP